MKIKIAKNIRELKPYEPGKPIEALQRELGISLKSIIKLASNENPLGPSPKAVRGMLDCVKNVHRYPDGACFYLKRKLAKKLNTKPDNLIMGNGSDEIIDMAVKAFACNNDEVIVTEPAFLEYRIISTAKGCKVKSIPMKQNFKAGVLSGFEYDVDRIVGSISKRTRIIFLGNPDNPTGAYLKSKTLKGIIKKCPQDVILIIDEAYRELVDRPDYEDSIKYANRNNVIILRTFSKAYGLAGLRVGYAIANKELIGWMERVRQPFNVNSIAQKAASAALDDKEFVKKIKKINRTGKKFLVEQLKKEGFNVIESPANFILFSRIGFKGTELFKCLLEKGIIVRDMKPYGLNEWARVSVGTMQENRKFIEALDQFKRLRR
jgi:histidinol-phosphate aminotransferase